MRRTSQCPFTATESVDIDELAIAEESRMMTELMDGIRSFVAVERLRVNVQQGRLLVRRLQLIYSTLCRLPDPRPTPPLLSVFRGAHELLRLLTSTERIGNAADGSGAIRDEWLFVVWQYFTCKAHFAALRARMQAAWKLQSTAMWESEDLRACAEDELANATLLVKEIGLEALSLQAAPAAEAASHCTDGGRGGMHRHIIDGTAPSALERGDETHEGQWLPKPVTAPPSPAAVEQVVQYYRRRQIGNWRIDYATLQPLKGGRRPPGEMHWPACESTSDLPATGSYSVLERSRDDGRADSWTGGVAAVSFNVSREDTEMGPVGVQLDGAPAPNPLSSHSSEGPQRSRDRFVVHSGFAFHGLPVVVKELEERRCGDFNPETLLSFVQELTRRFTWKHTNLVECVGGYTERFYPVATTPACAEEDAATPRPTEVSVALGLVMRDYTASGMRGLHEMLYVNKVHFSLAESISITLQVVDAMLYILHDAEEVPAAAVSRWIAVAPSNVLVASVETVDSCGPSLVFPSTRCLREPIARQADSREAERVLMPCYGARSPPLDLALAPLVSHGEAKEEEVVVARPRPTVEPYGTSLTETLSPKTYTVRYSPPTCVVDGPYSRWEPHPHAASPACYALIQLFLALLTNTAPYASLRAQDQLRERVFEAVPNGTGAAHRQSGSTDAVAAAGLPMIKATVPRGMYVPEALPEAVKQLCERCLALANPNRDMSLSASISPTTLLGSLMSPPTTLVENLIRPGSATEAGGSRGKMCLSELRQCLGYLHIMLTKGVLGDVNAAAWQTPCRRIVYVDDYGLEPNQGAT